jgi:hypothetical protein
MLRSVAGIAAGAALLLATGARPALAMNDNVVIKAHVPFAFEVDGQSMPAGNYVVSPVGVDEWSVMEIQNADGHGPAGVFLTVPRGVQPRGGHAKMVFDRVDGQMFLRSIRLPGQTGEALPVDRAELRAARAESPAA